MRLDGLKRNRNSLIAAAALAALLVFSLLLAPLWQLLQDALLLRRPHERALQANELAPEAQAMPLVAALWEKALYYDDSEFYYQDTMGPPADSDPTFYGWMNTQLDDAGVLPQGVSTLAGTRYRAGGATVDISPQLRQYDGMLLYVPDELVLSARVTLPAGEVAEPELEQSAQRYLEYLGLDVLDDWRPATLYRVPGMPMAGLYSQKAQLLVQVAYDTRGMEWHEFRCGVYPLGREAYAQQERNAR